jgi:hypothetical protein
MLVLTDEIAVRKGLPPFDPLIMPKACLRHDGTPLELPVFAETTGGLVVPASGA